MKPTNKTIILIRFIDKKLTLKNSSFTLNRSVMNCELVFINRINYNKKNVNELYDEKTLNFFFV